MEENEKMAFLGVLIITNNTISKTTIYRKKTEFIYIGNLSHHRLGNVAYYVQ